MKIILFVILGIFIFGTPLVFAEESLDLLVSPLVGGTINSDESQVLIVRDVKNSLTWHTAYPEIDGLDYVEGNTYLISAKKSFTVPLVELPKYELIEIKQVFKSHEPYSWKGLCVPGYHTWDGECVFAFRCSEDAFPGKPCTVDFIEQDYLRPLQQKKVGIIPEDVVCLEKLQLVLTPDNTPICVKSSSVDRLLDRGFTLGKNNNKSPYMTLMKQEGASVPDGYVSFVSEELNFSINHPESWKVQTNWPDDDRPPTIVISVNGETSTENYDTSLIIISAEPFSDELESMDEYVELISKNIDSQPQSDLFKATKEYVEFAGVEAFLVESEINNYGSEIHGLWYTVENNEMLYTILYTSSQSTYESNKELRNEFLSSFRLIPQ